MKKLFLIPICIGTLLLTSCEPKEPAILKVFVRSSTNSLVGNARVVVIGDQQSNPPTMDFVDTVYTNSSGFATINMDEYFNKYRNGDLNTTGQFDIIVEDGISSGSGSTRCRIHTTSVETVYLQ